MNIPQTHDGTYESFLRVKNFTARSAGFETVPDLNPAMAPHQRVVCGWALRLGKAAAFMGTGLGKSFTELEWARIVSEFAGMPVIVLAPLAVAHELIREAQKFGIPAEYHEKSHPDMKGVIITNYERLESFDISLFGGVVLDESSILKSYDGKTRTAIIDAFRDMPFRFETSATPAPNDYMELGNHAEFLGVMTRAEMLATFFVHDGGETQKWRLKKHAITDFWKWVCSWAVYVRKPSDLGFDDGPYILPELAYLEHVVPVGDVFAPDAASLQERITASRESIAERVAATAAVVNAELNEPWIVWCHWNAEAELLTKAIPGAVNLTGSDKAADKIRKMLEFLNGDIRVLVTKPSIAGWGMNWQHCARQAFVGLNDSWEEFYQGVRRCWRFGQKRRVEAHIFSASTEGAVLDNIKRKDAEAEHMAEQMVKHMLELTRMNLGTTERNTLTYDAFTDMIVPDWMSTEVSNVAGH